MPRTTTPDLSEFEAAAPPTRGCWFHRLDADQRAKAAAAHDAGYSNVTVAKVVTTWGTRVGSSSVGDHFRGACSCGDAA